MDCCGGIDYDWWYCKTYNNIKHACSALLDGRLRRGGMGTNQRSEATFCGHGSVHCNYENDCIRALVEIPVFDAVVLALALLDLSITIAPLPLPTHIKRYNK